MRPAGFITQAAVAFTLTSGASAQSLDERTPYGAILYGGFAAFSEGIGLLRPFAAPLAGITVTAAHQSVQWAVVDAYFLLCCGDAYTYRVGSGFAWNSAPDGNGVQVGGGGGYMRVSTGRSSPANLWRNRRWRMDAAKNAPQTAV